MATELSVLGSFTPYGLKAVPEPSSDALIEGREARYFLFESEASEHRLDATALGYASRDEYYQSKVGLGADGVFSEAKGEEEILVHSNTVIWSSHGHVRKSFTLPHRITQAMLVTFDMAASKMEDSTDKPSYASDLCVLHSDGISVFCADGKTFSVVTPYEMERMWPLPRGLLLQRSKIHSSSSFAPINGLYENNEMEDLPTLWSLKHPLEELRPVPFFDFRSSLAADYVPTPLPANRKDTGSTPKTPGVKDPQFETQLGKVNEKAGDDGGDFSRLITHPHLRLVYSSSDVPLIVVYNTETRLHSIWLVRKAEKVEILLSNEPGYEDSDLTATTETLQASFQAGYTRDLSWKPQNESTPSAPKCDVRLEHIFTEIPRYAAKDSTSQYTVRNVDGDGYEGSPQVNHVFLLVTPDAHLRLCFMMSELQQLHIYELTSPEDEDMSQNLGDFSPRNSPDSPSSESSTDLYRQSTLRVIRKRVVNCLSAIPLKVMDSVLLRVAKRSVLLSPTYLVLGLDHTISLYSMETKICDCHLPGAVAVEGLKTPFNPKTGLTTPTLHRTPSTSLLSRSLTGSTLFNRSIAHDSHSKQERPKLLQSIPRTPAAFNRSLSQSHLVFSPMTPGSPFHLDESAEMDLSAMDFDDEINSILNASTELHPTTTALSSATLSSRGLDTFQTPAKRLASGASTLTAVDSRLAPVTPAPGQSSRSAALFPTETNSSTKVVEILQPVSNRFSILYGDGRVFRVGLKIAPSDPTVSDCLKAASCILHHSSLYTFISCYLGLKHQLKDKIADEFEIFRLFLISLMPSTSAILKREQSSDGLLVDDVLKIGADDDDWEYLLGSDFHAHRMREPAYRSMPISKEGSSYTQPSQESQDKPSSTPGSSQLQSQKSALVDISITNILKPLCKNSESVRLVQKTLIAWCEREDAIALRSVVSHVHHALTLLCENYKLSSLTLVSVTKLTRVLLEVSALMRWQNYIHFYSSVINVSPLTIPQEILSKLPNEDMQPLMDQPASVLQWMRNCLNYARTTFPILREANSPCELTRKLCRIYHILVHGPPVESDEIEAYFEPFSTLPVSLGARLHKTPRTSPIKTANLSVRQRTLWKVRARLAVVAMDEEFADSSELNNFPPGVSLPLREAIQSTRQFPPPHWPLSCYRFIGREDLAMQGLSFGKVSKAKYSLADSHLDGGDSSSVIQSVGPQRQANESGLSKVLNSPFTATTSDSASSGQLTGGPNAASANGAAAGAAAEGSTAEVNFDGTDLTAAATLMRFSKDERLSEVSRVLRSSNVIQLVETEEIAHQSDAAQITSYSQQLLFYAMRSLALPIGRGMFTLAAELDHWGDTEIGEMIPDDEGQDEFMERVAKYGDSSSQRGTSASKSGGFSASKKVSPLAVLKSCARAEPLVIPQVMLKGRRPDNRTIVVLDPTPGAVVWPEFHNGVAAGLRLPPAEVEQVSWQWILSNRPKQSLNSAHAGMLLACGLLGHFATVFNVDATGLYDYLSYCHPLTSASLLVGYASSCYSTRSSQLSKVLEVHLPKPVNSGFATAVSSGYGFESDDVKVPEIVQCAAVVAAGFNYAETSNRHHVELFLSHLSNPRYAPYCLESFALSCGIALGFICLAQGQSAVGLADLNLLTRLCDCMDGGSAQRSGTASTGPMMQSLNNKSTVGAQSTLKSALNSESGHSFESLSKLHEEARSAYGLTSILSHNPLFAPPATGFSGNRGNALMTPLVSLRLGAFEMGIEPRRIPANTTTIGSEKPADTTAVQMKAPLGQVNKEISAPGAVLALTLIFLKTNDKSVAARLALPKGGVASSTGRDSKSTLGKTGSSSTGSSNNPASSFGNSTSSSGNSASPASGHINNVNHLASIRPDVQLQRVIGSNLIMWNDMDATSGVQGLTKWMQDQYPIGAMSVAQNLLLPAHQRLAPELVVLKHYSKSASSASSTGAAKPTEKPSAFATTTTIGNVSVQIEEATNLAKSFEGYRDIFELLKVAFLTTTGGCMMALGIKYAGTCDATVVSMLATQLSLLWKLQKAIPEKVDKKLAETCILQIALAWSLVMAGSGDLNLLRVLRKMRKKLGIDGKTADGIYGYQMAVSMAIGFLFLGGGRYSISSSNKAIASLLTSLYPLWPLSPAEERYHLQLLRHIYVMGIEPRCLEARDVDLLTPEFVPVKFWVKKHEVPKHAPNDHSGVSSSEPSTEKHASQLKNDKNSQVTFASSNDPQSLSDSSSVLPSKSTDTIEVIETVTPCLMPPRERLLKVEISSPFYWRASFRPNGSTLHQHMFQHQKFVLVKKRHGSTLEGEHPIANSNAPPMLSAASSIVPSSQFSFNMDDNAATANDWAFDAKSPYALSSRILSRHPTLKEYAKFLLSNPGAEDDDSGRESTSKSDSFGIAQMDLHNDLETLDILKSCMEEDKEQFLRTILWLNRYANTRGAALESFSLLDRANVDLVLQFYDSGIVDDFDPATEEQAAFDVGGAADFGSSSEFDFAFSSFTNAPLLDVSSSSSQLTAIGFSQSSSKSSQKPEKQNCSELPVPALVSPSLLQRIRSTRLRQMH